MVALGVVATKMSGRGGSRVSLVDQSVVSV
jgi:hypothetical protein